jgi:hypothetical protein
MSIQKAYYIAFSEAKNTKLAKERGISFIDVINILENGQELAIIEHHNKEKYLQQKIYVIEFEGYVYAVPFERRGQEIILKTIYPSRKLTKQYLPNYYQEVH